VNNRKVLDGMLEVVGLGGEENAARRLNALRALDKFDKFGIPGVRELLGAGRKDESGDFTKGVGLDPAGIELLVGVLDTSSFGDNLETVASLDDRFGQNARAREGVEELEQIAKLVASAGYDAGRIK